MTPEHMSLNTRAEQWWQRFFAVPFCFMGMGIFRVWTETLFVNAQVDFPALNFDASSFPFDAYASFDYLSSFILILLSIFSKRLAPLYSHPWAIACAFVSMTAATCINFTSIYFPAWAPLLRLPAVISGSLGIAFILMLWSEFFGCINPVRVVGYYSAGIAVSCIILWIFKGLLLPWLWVGTCIIPIVSLLCLWRSYKRLPRDAYPPTFQQEFIFPWKPVLVIGIYAFVYGMRSSVFAGPLSMNSGMGAFVGAAAVYLLFIRFGERLNFALLWRIAMPLMIVSLAPFDGIMPGWSTVADFCALSSYTILLLLIMAILSNLCYRYGVCALWIFGIERAVRMTTSQTGRLVGENIVGSSSLPDFAQSIALVVMAAGLIMVMCAFFSEKSVTSQWGIVLKHPIADDLELYMEKNRLGVKCREVAESYGLTSREGEILLLMARGGRLSQIANELSISNNTVKTHIRHIYTKLEINSRKELMILLGVRKSTESGTVSGSAEEA
ncbi:LuxR C-terminal-related transcriptional regulator [Adlercreutzia sp. R7]|uniref:LuxR C-terminal-related transcriptional regulator n=1 Tax=Adlercreutzia wanghongyangiae TaxID=3111451 RepID=A0ABU6IIB2_9ACTN|nr:LuxR C-terminal-related transcriptional regulator [Adlercreutzia sp. R7]